MNLQTFLISCCCLIVIECNIGNAQLVTFDQFRQAVTVHGYPEPSREQYDIFVNSAGPKGSIADKQEAAMCLTHLLHESGGLQAKREWRCVENGCPGEYETPGCDHPGQRYFGRGYIQLIWCFNYVRASQDLFRDDRLVRDPDSVAREESLSWDTAFWFWDRWVHPLDGVAQGRFGVTTNAINGGLECRGDYQHIARHRFEMYKLVREAFGLDPNTADERGCYN